MQVIIVAFITDYTISLAYVYGILGAIGVTGGSHRLWAHSAYKAKWPLRCLLMIMQTIAFQNSIWEWVRDHRCEIRMQFLLVDI